MQAPTNQQRGYQSRGRGGGGGGRNRGRGGRQRGGFNNNSTQGAVPTIQQVCVGAFVSIVLKVDQPTGRQVQGTVAELLTRGNHPRGIKVRLQDGRVGRVQRMASEEEISSQGILQNLGRNGEPDGGRSSGEPSHFRRAQNPRYTDVRLDGHPPSPPRAEFSLGDYLTKKSKRLSVDQEEPPELPGGNVTCPLCGKFEGDEAAVAHHINTSHPE